MKTPLRKLALVCLVCVSVSAAHAQTVRDRAIGLLVNQLRVAGYSHVTATQRLMGGYVVEARKGSEALVIALDGTHFQILDVQAFAAGEEGNAGFFATRSPSLSEAGRGALDRYSIHLAAGTGAPAGVNVTALLASAPTTGGTAGFSQTQTITTRGDTATVRQTETLGMLSPHVTLTETSVRADGKDSHAINQMAKYSRQEATTVVSISGGSGFAQQVFSDPQGFRNSISLAPPPVSAPILAPIDRSQIIDGVVSSIEGTLALLPADGRPLLPADLRDRVQTSLQPAR